MKGKINKNFIIVIIVILLAVSLVYNFRGEGEGEKVRKISFISHNISSAKTITCTYPQTLSASYQSGEISHSLPKLEINPMIFTFSELDDSRIGSLSYIDSTRTITNVQIVKLMEDDDKIIYIEGNGKNYLTTHTLYKNTGIATYVKNINILGVTPIATSAMGSCVGY